jgi:hypothetical protein
MGLIPMDLSVSYQRNPEPTAVPRGFGMERFNKVAERGQVIANIGGKVADIATDYAAKNKRADLLADELAARSQFKIIQTEAQLKASETDDPNEIRQIWTDAHGKYSRWVVGKSEKGVPNIRWSDQQKQMVAHSDALQGEFRTTAEMRIAEVGKRNSNAKALQAQRDAEMAGDRETITQAVQVRIENGTLTREEGEVERRASFLKSDLTLAKNNILNIDGMEPAKALEAATAFETALMAKEEDGSWAAFEHIPEADRKTLVKQAKDSALASTDRFKKQEALRVGTSNGRVFKFIQENERMPSPAERIQLNLEPETVKSLDTGRLEKISPALEGVAALSIKKQIEAYDKTKDPDGAQSLALMMRIDGFKDAGAKKWLSGKLADALSDDPTKGVDALAKTQIEDALVGAGFKDKKDNKALTREITLEHAAYDQWVKQKNPTPDERLAYAKSGRFTDLAKNKDKAQFRTKLIRGYSSPAGSGIDSVRKAAQSQYGMKPARQVVGVRKENGVVVAKQYDDGTIEEVK